MPEIPPPERKKQNCVIALFSEKARLDRLGEWNKRDKTRALKQGMVQELLTGRTKLV